MWAILLFISSSFSLILIAIGLITCFLISIISWKLKIINKNYNFLFLNLGFYRHFLATYMIYFIKSFIFIVKVSFFKDKSDPIFFEINLKKSLNKSDLSSFIATVTFIPGISYIETKNQQILIYAYNKKIFYSANLEKIYRNIYKINDDSLV